MAEEVSLEVAIEVVLRNGPTFETIAGLCKMAAEAERNRTWMQAHWTEYERSIAAAEREACAKVAEWEPCMTNTPKRIAAAIRARGQT